MSDLPEMSTPPDPEPAHPAGWSQRAKLLAGVGALVVAAGTGVAFSGALGGDDDPTAPVAAAATEEPTDEQQGAPGQGGTFGTITEVSDDGFTLTTDADEETVEVAVSDDTTITDTTSGTVEDLEEGDNVRILGQADDDGSVTARQIIDSADDADLLGRGGGFGGDGGGGEMPQPPEGAEASEGMQSPDGMPPGGAGFGGGTIGTIASLDGDTLTVTSEDGETVTVTLTEDTDVRLVQASELDELEVDDTVSVRGETSDGVLTAATVQRGEAGFGPGGGDMGRPPSDAPPSADADEDDDGDA